MDNKTKARLWVAVMGAALWGLSCWLVYDAGYRRGCDTALQRLAERADTVIKTDTVRVPRPAAADSSRAGVVTVPVRVVAGEPDEPLDLPDNTILIFPPSRLVPDSSASGTYSVEMGTELPDTAREDTLRAVVPLTQKEYRDSLYTAWVSGFMPRLDSIHVYGRTKTVTIRQTVTKRNAFNVGITGGVGYGVFTKKPDMWVGVGATWNLFGR